MLRVGVAGGEAEGAIERVLLFERGVLPEMLHQPHRLADHRRSEQARFDGLDLSTAEGRHLAAAYVAAEGAFLLRGFRMMAFSDPTWDVIWSEVMKLVRVDRE